MKTYFVVRQLILAFFLTLTTLVSGCGSTSHSVPASYTLQFQAHPQVNASAPLKVRVLLLKSDATFMSADFWSLCAHYAGRGISDLRAVHRCG